MNRPALAKEHAEPTKSRLVTREKNNSHPSSNNHANSHAGGSSTDTASAAAAPPRLGLVVALINQPSYYHDTCGSPGPPPRAVLRADATAAEILSSTRLVF